MISLFVPIIGGNKHRFTGWQSDDKEIPVIQDYDDDSHPVGNNFF